MAQVALLENGVLVGLPGGHILLTYTVNGVPTSTEVGDHRSHRLYNGMLNWGPVPNLGWIVVENDWIGPGARRTLLNSLQSDKLIEPLRRALLAPPGTKIFDRIEIEYETEDEPS